MHNRRRTRVTASAEAKGVRRFLVTLTVHACSSIVWLPDVRKTSMTRWKPSREEGDLPSRPM